MADDARWLLIDPQSGLVMAAEEARLVSRVPGTLYDLLMLSGSDDERMDLATEAGVEVLPPGSLGVAFEDLEELEHLPWLIDSSTGNFLVNPSLVVSVPAPLDSDEEMELFIDEDIARAYAASHGQPAVAPANIEPGTPVPGEPLLDVIELGLLIMEAVATLHEQGCQRLRIHPGASGSGMHWRIAVTTVDNLTGDEHGHVWLTDAERDFAWTSASAPMIRSLRATASTTPSEVASEIFDAVRGAGYGPDPEYAAWLNSLIATVKNLRRLPLAYSDWHDPSLGWELEGNLRFAPPPGQPKPVPSSADRAVEG